MDPTAATMPLMRKRQPMYSKQLRGNGNYNLVTIIWPPRAQEQQSIRRMLGQQCLLAVEDIMVCPMFVCYCTLIFLFQYFAELLLLNSEISVTKGVKIEKII